MSPPCQAFSSHASPEDERSALVFRAVDAGEIWPRAIIILENVAMLDSGPYRDEFLSPLRSALARQRRAVAVMRIDAADLGVASSRPRTFVLASPVGGRLPMVEFPKRRRSQREAIGKGFVDLDPEFVPLTGKEMVLYGGIPAGGDWRSSEMGRKYARLKGVASGNFLQRRGWNEAASCVMASTYALGRLGAVHPGELRRYTVGESKALLSVPQEYVLVGDLAARYRMLGNAVAPPVAEALGRAILQPARSSRREAPSGGKIEEKEVLAALRSSKRVLLIEPLYARRYPPLGLCKIATFVKSNGGKVQFVRDPTAAQIEWADLICLSSLFTYESDKVHEAYAKVEASGKPIIIGGIYASLCTETAMERMPKARIFAGNSAVLDQVKPDRSLDWDVEGKWNDFDYVFTSRGCCNKCAYCAVWRIEKPTLYPRWDKYLSGKPFLMVSDNNLTSTPESHWRSVLGKVSEMKVKLVLDNGLDCRKITPEWAKELAKIRWLQDGLRLAFDHMGVDGTFQRAVRMIQDAGVPRSAMMAYVLFNFHDTVEDADHRARECWDLGIRPYPQRYTPLDKLSKNPPYIGKYWSPEMVRAFRMFWLWKSNYMRGEFKDWLRKNQRELTAKIQS